MAMPVGIALFGGLRCLVNRQRTTGNSVNR